jgi:hypothetical protein
MVHCCTNVVKRFSLIRREQVDGTLALQPQQLTFFEVSMGLDVGSCLSFGVEQ